MLPMKSTKSFYYANQPSCDGLCMYVRMYHLYYTSQNGIFTSNTLIFGSITHDIVHILWHIFRVINESSNVI